MLGTPQLEELPPLRELVGIQQGLEALRRRLGTARARPAASIPGGARDPGDEGVLGAVDVAGEVGIGAWERSARRRAKRGENKVDAAEGLQPSDVSVSRQEERTRICD